MSSRGLALLLACPQEDFLFLLRQPPAPALPEGVLTEIIMHLELRDTLACRLVNKAWSRAAGSIVRHLNIPYKAMTAAARVVRDNYVDTTLRRLHRIWPAAEAVTLSGLAAGRALQEDLSLQLLANHLSRWRNLREVNLQDMPVTPVPALRLAKPHVLPVEAPARNRQNHTFGQSHGTPAAGDGGAAAATAAVPATPPSAARLRDATAAASDRRWSSGGGSSGGGGWSDGGAMGNIAPGPWSLGCLSCCLGLTRLDVELVPAKEPPPLPRAPRCGSASTRESAAHSQRQEAQRWRQQQSSRRPDPAQLAAGQLALLEGLTRLTRLSHLSIRLLDLPVHASVAGGWAAAAADGSETESEVTEESDREIEGLAARLEEETETSARVGNAPMAAPAAAAAPLGPASVVPAGAASAATAATTAASAEPQVSAAAAAAAGLAEDYILDIEEAGNYGSDLDMDQAMVQELDTDSGLDSCPGEGPIGEAAAELVDADFPVPSRPHHVQGKGGAQPAQVAVQSSSSGGGGSGTGSRRTWGNSEAGSGSANGSGCEGAVGDGDAGSSAAVAAPRRRSFSTAANSHWIPHPALFVRMGPRLRSLRLTGCDLRGGGALVALAGSLTCLTSLSLQGRLGVSHDDLAALSKLRDLQDLSLSRVDLIYRGPDERTAALMTELYDALRQLRNFQSLKLELDSHCGNAVHSDCLPLCDSPPYDSLLPRLRSLSLSIILESDLALHMLARLTSLTALNLTYWTSPVALWLDDMTMLAPLTGLRSLSMHHGPLERDFIISLNGRVVHELAGAWPHLTQLAFTGQILPDISGAPSLASLSSWTSLRDLSLTAVEVEDGSQVVTSSNRARSSSSSSSSWVPCGDDGDNSEAAEAAGAVDLGVAVSRCLPPSLTRLALSGVRLGGGELLQLLAGSLTGLTSLQVLDCGLTPTHLMVGDCGATQLQVLVLNDSRPWRACQPRRKRNSEHLQKHESLGHPAATTHPAAASAPAAAAAAARPAAAAAMATRQELDVAAPYEHGAAAQPEQRRRGSSASRSPFFPRANWTGAGSHSRSCSCCCSPSIWAGKSCLTAPVRTGYGTRYPVHIAAASFQTVGGKNCCAAAPHGNISQAPSSTAAAQPRQWSHPGMQERQRVGPEQDGGQQPHVSGSSPTTTRSQDGFGFGGLERSDSGGQHVERDAGTLDGTGGGVGSCYCWRRRLIRHGLATLGSLRSLEFLLLGLPDDEFGAAEALQPLAALTGLRCLTLRARGLRAASAGEVSGPLERMTQLRSLHLTGPRAGSAVAQGVEDAARRLPYLK